MRKRSLVRPDLPFKELDEGWLVHYQREYCKGNLFAGKG